ncbi:hypothetical protein BS50DRAFT_627075 [Corynespora cassiicola Philippines]|uniref:Uncharacterized protein n=1 Tax=Corynespora cassiicola Philippines TaxID=1448308 RepID=A0A2T2MZV3_CORCC|nr:hypothetical protein BS50DRAFT_627075 [Corynespora cassiicola Philippines]
MSSRQSSSQTQHGAGQNTLDASHPHLQEPLTRIHNHLVDISHLARRSYDELIRHQSNYEQAYLSERDKLAQNVAAYKALQMEKGRSDQEIRYCKEQLLPQYDDLVQQQKQEVQEVQEQLRDLEAKHLELGKEAYKEKQEHQGRVDTMAGMLQAQDRKIEELETQIRGLSESHQLSRRLQPPRASKRQLHGK